MAAPDPISVVFAALADPTRRAILTRLGQGDATVGELAEPFAISLPAISRHLKVLEQAGLIERSRQAQWRTSTLRAEGLQPATDWIEEVRRLWGDRFDRLDAHLDFLKAQLAPESEGGPASSRTRSEHSSPTTEGGSASPTPAGGETSSSEPHDGGPGGSPRKESA